MKQRDMIWGGGVMIRMTVDYGGGLIRVVTA